MTWLRAIRCWLFGHRIRRGTISRVDQGSVDVVLVCIYCGYVEDGLATSYDGGDGRQGS